MTTTMITNFYMTTTLTHTTNTISQYVSLSVADPGFPVGGGMDLIWGAVDPRGSYVSKILHVKMKESGPVGGGTCQAHPPRSANACDVFWDCVVTCIFLPT